MSILSAGSFRRYTENERRTVSAPVLHGRDIPVPGFIPQHGEARVTDPGFGRRGSLFGSWRRPLQNSRPAHDAGAFSSGCRISSRHFLRYLRHVRPVPRSFLRHPPLRHPSRFRGRQAHTSVPAPEDDGGNSPAPDRSPIP